MAFRSKSNGVHMLIAVFSMCVAALCIFIYDRLPYKEEKADQWLVNHICLLHIFGSVFLFVCALKPNKWFLMAYLISAFIFVYTLVYKSLNFWFTMDLHTYKAYSLINLILYSFAGFWIYFITEVCLAFQDGKLEKRSTRIE